MKKLFLLLTVVLIAFIALEREKLFVRDPLATVTRNGMREDGAQVYINIHNDVLIENDNPPLYVEVVERGSPIGLPKESGCVHWAACLLDGYPPTLVATRPGASIESMDSKVIRFTDTGNKETVVTLR